MVAGFLLVESGLWLGGRLMRSHIEAAGREKNYKKNKSTRICNVTST